ncbi:MAG: hypothetical protein ACPGGK_16665 [Pikeienuella sp.]
MRSIWFLFSTICLSILTACGGGSGTAVKDPQMAEFIRKYNESRGITAETHGSPSEMALFTEADVPKSLVQRENTFSGAKPYIVIQHAHGYSGVEILYELRANDRYAENGTGVAIPIDVRIDPPYSSNTLLQRDVFRRLEIAETYNFGRAIYAEENRSQIIQLATEVLTKTHCLVGEVTQNAKRGTEAYSVRPGQRVNGISIDPGWIVHLRCSRWRQK